MCVTGVAEEVTVCYYQRKQSLPANPSIIQWGPASSEIDELIGVLGLGWAHIVCEFMFIFTCTLIGRTQRHCFHLSSTVARLLATIQQKGLSWVGQVWQLKVITVVVKILWEKGRHLDLDFQIPPPFVFLCQEGAALPIMGPRLYSTWYRFYEQRSCTPLI